MTYLHRLNQLRQFRRLARNVGRALGPLLVAIDVWGVVAFVVKLLGVFGGVS